MITMTAADLITESITLVTDTGLLPVVFALAIAAVFGAVMRYARRVAK
jgi:hypothetical protein